jgi:uncharacterized membrane protein
MKHYSTRKIFVLFMLLLFLAQISQAAVISGSIYNLELKLEKDSIVEINTEPKQTIVAKDGSYSFNVPLGNYVISARSPGNYISEELSVKSEGNYTLDIILWPSLEEEDELLASSADINESLDNDLPLDEKSPQIILYVVAVIIVLIVYVILSKKKKFKKLFNKHKDKILEDGDETNTENKYVDKIIELLEYEGGRTTQKNIRKHLPLSEAKISLILAELEHDDKIKKFKKGRANIVVLKKKE